MKNKRKNTKNNLNKFTSRAKRKTQDKHRQERELLRALAEVGIASGRSKIRFSYDGGYSRRKSGGERGISAEGIYSETQYGYGFVSVPDEKRDIFIPDGKSLDALGGDTVRIVYDKFYSAGEEKTEGRVLEVLEYGKTEIIGVVYSETLRRGKSILRRYYLKPDTSGIKRNFYLISEDGVSEGDKILAKIKRRGTGFFECSLIENFGKCLTKEANYRAILAECGIETDFSPAEIATAENAAAEKISYEGRKVRNEVIFTIDSESAKDLDDAVSCEKSGEGYILGVHIADVSEYVREKSVLERLATRRGTSVYFTDKVVPMLPEALSNRACSLNPEEEKYALSAIMSISEDGEIEDVKIEPSVIVSKVKGIYSEINTIFSGEENSKLTEKYRECIPSLKIMKELYLVLAKKSAARGALNLDSAEAEIILDEDGAPKEIIKRERGDAEKMIEQFMLAANEAVATYLIDRGIPCVFRVHSAPPAEKLSCFIDYAKNLGLNTSGVTREEASAKDFAKLLLEASERGISEAVSYTLLRSMAKAEYSSKRGSHFGLNIEKYCHFTSPIRRLSDLATHRIIKKVLIEGKEGAKYTSFASRMAAAATDGEIRALSAERKIENLYKTIFMKNKVGEEFEAVINSITSFGIFATLENTCEGLIPISELGEGFRYDENSLTVRSADINYRIGDRIKIRVEEADIAKGKIRFSITE